MSALTVGAAPSYVSPQSMSAPRAGAGAAASAPDQRLIAQLQQRDRVVRAHEMAHVAAGSGLVTRGASYSYQTGPDGQRYAIGGEVGIDVSPGRTPQETLAKAERIRAAALAPVDPSGQDRRVAAQADRMALEARQAMVEQAAGPSAGPAGTYVAIAAIADGAAGGGGVDTYA